MSKLHDNPFRPDYDGGAPEPAPQSQYIKGLDMAQDMRRKTPRTDDLRRELEALPKYGQYGYNAEAFAVLIFKRYTQLESELAAATRALQAQLRTTYSGKAFVRLAEEFKDERRARERVGQMLNDQMDCTVKEFERAEIAERQLAELREAAKAVIKEYDDRGLYTAADEALRKLVEGK